MDVIEAYDLEGVPGLPSGVDHAYLARRASSSVAAAWCRPVDPPPDWVKNIAIDVAIRGAANPTGRSSRTLSRSLDDAARSETERFESGVTGFALSAAELAILCPKVRRSVGSIRLRVPGYQP